MPLSEASFSGTVRMILVLIALWVIVRWFLRQQSQRHGQPFPPRRPQGDVRIENAPRQADRTVDDDRIVDADYEEIK